ncbi:MAG: hypothetical protein IPG61_18805 [bacterium]|nr:hypothetical protein [bacterium]
MIFVQDLPLPPVKELGLPEKFKLKGQSLVGITYGARVYVTSRAGLDSLLFHEMVHVIQWSELGAERFLLTYAFGLDRTDRNEYFDIPLENMAYSLQRDFDNCVALPDLETKVRLMCAAIWAEVEQALHNA